MNYFQRQIFIKLINKSIDKKKMNNKTYNIKLINQFKKL